MVDINSERTFDEQSAYPLLKQLVQLMPPTGRGDSSAGILCTSTKADAQGKRWIWLGFAKDLEIEEFARNIADLPASLFANDVKAAPIRLHIADKAFRA